MSRRGSMDRAEPSLAPVANLAVRRVMSATAGRHMPTPSRQRQAPTAGAMLRRRIALRLVKVAMPVLALALLGTIAFWPELKGDPEHSRVSFRRTTEPRAEALRVVSPRYNGLDEQGRPYTVTAEVAQQVGAEEILDLTQPRADIELTDGGWVYLRADAGRYEKAENRLTLRGNVTIYHDGGTMLRTASALVLPDKGTASGDDPVAAQGSFGTLVSEGFRLSERGSVVVFTGRAHAVLEGEED